jgi:hypothetical protein
MPEPGGGSSGGFAPVAVVWCRQVDNEAESPGYTTIPEDFAGRRETLEAIRLVGNLTINIADTHDYWDPDPAQPLSYYPNLFLYPAASGRYTCVGRMFLSTEDRPRLGMKTLVFSTADLVASGEFGAAVLRAHATMGGQSSPGRPAAEPDAAVYQSVGEGFLFHRGTTEPVVIVAAEQWEAACQVILDLVRLLPTSLVALGAFLVFPYFLPEAKVNLHEFTEQVPLALGLMRVPRGEAQGERHTKRIQSWESAPVALRDLTHPPTARGKETLPLILQYARDHQEDKLAEVAHRVDLVEGPRVHAHLNDTERQGGRDRRKEMWRIGTAMETAALLLARPKGRTVPTTGEVAKRANEYLQAQPSIPLVRPSEMVSVSAAAAVAGPGAAPTQHPPWLRRPTDIQLPTSGPVGVPVSVSDDPSVRPPASPMPTPTTPVAVVPTPPLAPAATELPPLRSTSTPAAASLVPARPPPGAPLRAPTPISPAPAAATPAAPMPAPDLEAWVKSLVDRRVEETQRSRPSAPDPAVLEGKVALLVDQKLREANAQTTQTLLGVRSDLGSRIAAVESRPVVDPVGILDQVDQRVQTKLEPMLAELTENLKQRLQSTDELWAERLREELRQNVEELRAQSVRSEEELRAALVAQLDLELAETKDQASSTREEVEGRVRELLQGWAAELDQRHGKEVRDLETRLGILVDGRTKDLEKRLVGALADQREKVLNLADERIQLAENRVATEREARVAEVSEASTAAVAGLQVRLQAYFEQKIRENQEREREKYVELLARLKNEVEGSLANTMDSNRFDAAIRDRVGRMLESAREDQEKIVAAGLADAEVRLKGRQEESILRLERLETKLQQRETDLARVERNLRQEADDLDRRIQVLSDRMMPLVRKTWLKIGELEKGGPVTEEGDTRLNELRRELVREMRRVEGELLEQTSELRDRLEGTIAHQGRIWLNLLKQLSAETEEVVRSGPRTARRPAKGPETPPEDDFLGAELRAAYPTFGNDPPNPMDPTPALGPDATVERRRLVARDGKGSARGGQG